MSARDQRHSRILGLVRGGAIRRQGEILRALEGMGLGVEQSTLSRDFQELGIHKEGGRYRYRETTATSGVDLEPAVRGFVRCGDHLIVIHTAVGQAQAVAVAIDEANVAAIVGTVAGDDTVFVATRARNAQEDALAHLRDWFGEKDES